MVESDATARDDHDPIVTEVDLAIFRLRRIWQKPPLNRRLRTLRGDSERIHLSNIYVVHAIARLAADCDTAVTIGAVAERLDVDPSTASRLVAGAIDAGMVTRRASTADARRAQLALTEAGRNVLDRAADIRRSYIDRLMDNWSPDDRRAFARLLTEFVAAADASAPDLDRVAEVYDRLKP